MKKLTFLAGLLLVGFAPTVHAEGDLILWGHGELRGDEVIWMNNNQADSRATDTATGPGYCPDEFAQTGCPASGSVKVPGSFDVSFVFGMDPKLGEVTHLAVGGTATFHLFFGANTGECDGIFTAMLADDAGQVAATAPTAFSFANGYEHFTAEAAIERGDIGNAENLAWTVSVQCDGTGLFMGVHQDTGRTRAILPLATPSEQSAATVTYQDFDGELLQVSLDSRSASTKNYHYNWTSPESEVFLQFTASVEAGGAKGIYGQGAASWQHQFSGMSDTGQETIAVEPGASHLWLNLTNFVGSINVQVFPQSYGEPTGNEPGAPGSNSNTSTQSTGTGQQAGSDVEGGPTGTGDNDSTSKVDEDAPGFALPLLVIALLGLALRRRN